jgi:hypothetical protein
MENMIEKHSNAKMQVWQRGVKFTLTNGYTLSCAFGYGNYCSNQHDHSADLANKDCHKIESPDFEVAVFEPNGDMVDLFPAEEPDGWSDQVIGFVPASALPMLISALKFWPVRPSFDLDIDIPADVQAARQQSIDTFEHSLRNRCTVFRKICKDFMDKADEEAASA